MNILKKVGLFLLAAVPAGAAAFVLHSCCPCDAPSPTTQPAPLVKPDQPCPDCPVCPNCPTKPRKP